MEAIHCCDCHKIVTEDPIKVWHNQWVGAECYAKRQLMIRTFYQENLSYNFAVSPDEVVASFSLIFDVAEKIQHIIPDLIWVGGSAIYAYIHIRESVDIDHVLPNLAQRWDELCNLLEKQPGWKTTRKKRPINLMGRFNGIPVTIRTQMRSQPINTITVTFDGKKVNIASLQELQMMKLLAMANRRKIKDFVDVVELHKKSNIIAAVKNIKYFYNNDEAKLVIETLKNPEFTLTRNDPTVSLEQLRADISVIADQLDC